MTIRSAFAPPKSGLEHEFSGRGPRSTGFAVCELSRNAAMMVVAAENAVNAKPLSG
jgi:hypothetical protein